ncbi:MAG: DUF4926 domain-containing protein [Acidobacteria bacterium]|nr:DUF4926 domain-containing protein [Acidobacteriota bacterium]
MSVHFELLDVVTLTCNIADGRFEKGTTGTIVEVLAPGVFMVEFDGDTELVLPAVKQGQLKLEWRNGMKSP